MLGDGNLDRYRGVVEPLAEEFDVVDVALAAVSLAEGAGGRAGEDERRSRRRASSTTTGRPRERPIAAGRPGAGRVRRPTAAGAMGAATGSRLFVGAGRRAGMRPGRPGRGDHERGRRPGQRDRGDPDRRRVLDRRGAHGRRGGDPASAARRRDPGSEGPRAARPGRLSPASARRPPRGRLRSGAPCRRSRRRSPGPVARSAVDRRARRPCRWPAVRRPASSAA